MLTWIWAFLLYSWKIETLFPKLEYQKLQTIANFILKPTKVRKRAKIMNGYNQAPYLTQDTNGKETSQTRAKRSALSQQVTTRY